MPTITASDGCRLTYDVAGNGEALLLIPGLGGVAAFWSDIVPRLAGRHRVIAFDHRGTGRSARPAGRYTLSRIAEDALNILDAEKVEAAAVVGHSTGGRIAQLIALDAPQRVEKLVISGSWDMPDARFRLLFETRLAVLRTAGPAVYQALTHCLGYPADFIEANHGLLEETVEAAKQALAPLDVTESRIAMLLSDDRAGGLEKIVAPTLVLAAFDDAIIPFHHAARLVSAIRGARLETLDGGHFFPRVHPEKFAEIVSRFLEGRDA